MNAQALLEFSLALIPVVWLIGSLGVFKIAAPQATTIGLVITIVLAIGFFKLSPILAFSGMLEGFLMGIFPIIYVIIAALFTYNVASSSGALRVIQDLLSSITMDKRILVLIIAWGFGGFLEAIAGFGTAVAIPAGILMAFGIEPIRASIICLIANTTPTAFGAIGLPVITLADVTHLDKIALSTVITFELLPLIVLIPFVLVTLVSGSIKKIKGVFLITLASGLSFALPQILVARFIGPELPAIVGALVSILVTVILAKRQKNDNYTRTISIEKHTMSEIFVALAPFLLVFFMVLLASPLFGVINHFLNQFQVSLRIYPDSKKPFTFAYLASPGTLIIISTIIGGLVQKVSLKTLFQLFVKTVKGLGKTTITVCSIVALAKIMGYSGMTQALAITIVGLMGPIYPLFAPLIGAIGTFVTGSDTSANVLFGNLQLSASQQLTVNSNWLVGGNMVGATAGKMISPQSIAVATAATNLEGKEGEILKEALKWCGLYLLVICSYLYLVGLILGMLHF